MLKRLLSGSIGVIAVVAGIFFALAYAAPALEDFNNPRVSFRLALVGNVIVWVITAAAIILGVRFLRFASVSRHRR